MLCVCVCPAWSELAHPCVIYQGPTIGREEKDMEKMLAGVQDLRRVGVVIYESKVPASSSRGKMKANMFYYNFYLLYV